MTAEKGKWSAIGREIARLASLADDRADDKALDQAIRAGVEMRGTNLWVLMFAIFIASVGLNVNSTAVIIGAMLVSPLMGPIMGIGYGVGVYDFALVRSGFKNLGLAVLISLVTSIIYFAISPLTQAQSELLARTTPTIWDVLIALFGGLAGIVGATRKEKSNVIPGVAIATALMPPLCTAGYGIAIGNWAYFAGAFYLFTINCVFIALSSALVIRLFHVAQPKLVDERITAHVKRLALLIAFATIGPSIYLAYQLVQDEFFKSRAAGFVATHIASDRTYVTQSKIDPKGKLIEATLIGEYLPATRLAEISAKLPAAGLDGGRLVIHQQADQQRIDVRSLRSELLSDLYTKAQQQLEEKDRQIQQLRLNLDTSKVQQDQMKRLPLELHTLFPTVTDVWLTHGIYWTEGSDADQPTAVLNVNMTKRPSTSDQTKIQNWAKARLQIDAIKLVVQVGPHRPPAKRELGEGKS
jgi:uncharacterized hydrophobic protein (TIGR00271 family)